MTADVGRNLGKLIFIDVVVFSDAIFEVMLPVQRNHWVSILIIVEEFPHSIDDGFHLWRSSPLQNGQLSIGTPHRS